MPRPSRGSGVLSAWGGAYGIKNYILHPGLEFSDDTAARYGIQRLDKAVKFLGSKYNRLHHDYILESDSSL